MSGSPRGLMAALCCKGDKTGNKPAATNDSATTRATEKSAVAPTDRGTVASQAPTLRDPTMVSQAASTRGPTMASQAASGVAPTDRGTVASQAETARGQTMASQAASTRGQTVVSQAVSQAASTAEPSRPFGTPGRGTPPALRAELAAEGGWDKLLEKFTVDDSCCAFCVAQLEEGAFYAAAPGDAGWTVIFAEPHTEEIMQDDGETMTPTLIDEAFALKTVAETGSAPDGGLWLGGIKHRITQADLEYQEGENTYHSILVVRKGGGARVVKTSSLIVVGFFDEAKGQCASGCTAAVMSSLDWVSKAI